MSIIELDGPPSWSLNASETGESTKCPWVGVVEGTAGGINRECVAVAGATNPANTRQSEAVIVSLFFLPRHPNVNNPTATTHGHFVLSPVSLASRDQDGGPSSSTNDIYDVTEK